MSLDRPLRIATRAYYWKPGMAWFRALELDLYRSIGVVLHDSILDLGCGDGQVAGMLRELGLIQGRVHGLDPASSQLSRAARAGAHDGLVLGEGGRLPFRDGSFAAVLCNGSLSSIPNDPGDTLREVHRVLMPGGVFLATFPTDRFLAVLLWPRLLRLWPAARRTYERRMTLRQPHFTADSPAGWIRRLEDAGLEVERTATFFSRRAGEIWNLLSMHALRVVGTVRLLPAASRASAAAVARALERAYSAERGQQGEGYMLVVARRAGNDSRPGAVV